jgi:drug/metabolite transporter (DMT)-like permease
MTAGFTPLHLPPGGFEVTVIAFSCADAIATITFVKLIRYAGPVFTSQKAYTVAIGGVAWSVLLLKEHISATSAVALALILVGLYFVAKKSVQEELLKPYPAV